MKKSIREAVATVDDLSMEEIDALYESNRIENEDSIEALEDAIEAWRYAREHKDEISVAYILEIHRLLMKRLRPDIAGKLRDCDVWIGGKCKFFVSQTLLKEQLQQWIEESEGAIYQVVSKQPAARNRAKEELAKKMHVAYEEAHVFTDSNGRSGRILYQVHRLLLGLPIEVIDSKTKYDNYYPWFKK